MLLQYYFQKSGQLTFPLAVDLEVYLEYLGGINLDGVLNIEYLQGIAVSVDTILEYLGSVTPNFQIELEWLLGLGGDHLVQIEHLIDTLPIGLLKWTIKNNRKVWILAANKTWTLT